MFFAGYWLSPTIQAVSTMSNLKASKKKKAPKGNKTTGIYSSCVCLENLKKEHIYSQGRQGCFFLFII